MIETDVLGEPWQAETIGLPPDEEGAVVTTLVSRRAEESTGRAVLHLHGFSDYFFQTQYAEWWLARGYDFYAVDLRKYGRSLRPHQTPMYITDLHDYFAELDLAWDRIVRRDGHDRVIASAHSTGGLTLPLWAHHRQPDELAGMVLNSPWLDLQGKAWMRTPAADAALARLARSQPRREIPRQVSGFYGQSLHRDHHGEWEFNLDWRPIGSFPARAAWLHAIRRGHAELHAGLAVPAPVLVLSSGASTMPAAMGEDVFSHDIVLEVPQIRRWATSIGTQVTYTAVEGALHDVFLSRAGARERGYDVLERWHSAFVDKPA
ncbi:alpha/beta hydrolase [Nocardioides limicola]|uniref:alpha/beta hydrolase n=1 Tax=Nocardioides limicola TaxID=2803368 RepID=UPI001EF138FC|nr:alpha/beta hydrolase [Nocardioides sp. DJM-14]